MWCYWYWFFEKRQTYSCFTKFIEKLRIPNFLILALELHPWIRIFRKKEYKTSVQFQTSIRNRLLAIRHCHFHFHFVFVWHWRKEVAKYSLFEFLLITERYMHFVIENTIKPSANLTIKTRRKKSFGCYRNIHRHSTHT